MDARSQVNGNKLFLTNLADFFSKADFEENIHHHMLNAGENSEYYLKAFLVRERDLEKRDTIFGNITELSDDNNLRHIRWNQNANDALDNFDTDALRKILKLSKSRSRAKADLSINNVRYSLKEINSNPPAIINHTTRPGFETACKIIGMSIENLDKIISEYWDLRINGRIKEDVGNNDPDSPFSQHKNYLKPIINYFVFTGTGSGRSKYPADKVLEVEYKKLPQGLKIIEKDNYFDSVWDNLVFSVRSKGMPPNYPQCNNFASISMWTKCMDGLYKGALHVRAK